MTYLSPAFVITDYLIEQTVIPLSDIADVDTTWGRYIFRDGMPLALSGTGMRAVVINSGTPGSSPGHAYANAVSVRCYADHTRDPDNLAVVSVEDGTDRAWAMYGKIDHLLHNPKRLSADPFVQSDRSGDGLESFDQEQNMPYIVATFNVSILAAA